MLTRCNYPVTGCGPQYAESGAVGALVPYCPFHHNSYCYVHYAVYCSDIELIKTFTAARRLASHLTTSAQLHAVTLAHISQAEQAALLPATSLHPTISSIDGNSSLYRRIGQRYTALAGDDKVMKHNCCPLSFLSNESSGCSLTLR